MGIFGNKENRFALSFFGLAHDYGLLSNQKVTSMVAVANGINLVGALADMSFVIREQRKRLEKINEISAGRLKFIREAKEILPTLRTHELGASDYSHFAEVVIPIINFALQSEVVQASDYYRDQVCPLLYEEYRKVAYEARKYSELAEEERKEEPILKLEEQILKDLKEYLNLQEKSILAIRVNNGIVSELARLAKLVKEENRLASILFTDENVVKGLMLALSKMQGDFKKYTLKRKSRIRSLIRIIFRGVAPVGLAVWLALLIIKPPKYTLRETEESFRSYVGKTPSQVVSQLKVDNLAQDIREQLIREVKGKVTELPGGRKEVHEASFEATAESLMVAYHEALMRVFREKYEEKISQLKAEHPEMQVPDMDWDEASARIRSLIRFDKPTILKEMKKIRENESFIDYLKRTGGRPTWTNQAEKDIERWSYTRVQQIFTDLRRKIGEEIDKKLTPDFILEVEQGRKSGKPLPWYLEIIADTIVFLRDNLLILLAVLLLSYMPPKKLNPFNILRRASFGYYKKGFKDDISVLLHGYMLEALKKA